MSTMTISPNSTAESTHGGIPDAIVEVWVRAVESGLPNNESPASREALNKLVSWMAKFTPKILQKLAAHFHVPRPVVEDMRRDLREIIQAFLICAASKHPSACPGVTAYVRYSDAERADGTIPRSFWQWCFFGTRTRLFSFLKQTARLYGAPAELFKARESGQRARRRFVQAGKLVEYLRLERHPNGAETWCHRTTHPEGQQPPNAVPSTERRFLLRAQAELNPNFLLTEEHKYRERVLLEYLDDAKGIFEVRCVGNASHPALLLWLFGQLNEPFPLLATTVDGIFAANTRFRNFDPEMAQQEDLGLEDSVS